VAFFATAVVAVGAIFFGYLPESFPDSYYNDLDRFVIKACKKTKDSKAILWLFSGWHTIKNRLKSCLGLKPATPPSSLPPEPWQEAFSRFILTLSDQQLVTGLAILIGAVSNQQILSVYEFSVVLSLAWFSSTTHLATLDALREYFLEHKVVRNWRVGGMLSLLALLSYCLVTAMLAQTRLLDPTVPIQCYPLPQPTAEQCGRRSRCPNGVISFVATFLTLYFLLSGYLVRIRALYNPRHKSSIWMAPEGWFAWGAVKLLDPRLRLFSPPNFVDVKAEVQSPIRLENLMRIIKTSAKNKDLAKLLSSSYQYDDSFLSSMSGLSKYGARFQLHSFRT
jgi:hypothetical protein